LTQMPPEWLAELRQAAMVGDITRMAILIQNCHDANPALNAHLSQLSNEFRHDEILRLVDLAIHTAQGARR
ncbi:MAG TPA: hypothetical protein VLS48_05275, partial [Anaerolineales bacterium]|nr:hypothetical protein [Anaerolineales bacterium]